MKNQFSLLKNGKNAETVWANAETGEIYPANRNSFGYNALQAGYETEFYKKYGCNMKLNRPNTRHGRYSYSARQMQEIGFKLVMRGSEPLWNVEQKIES